MAYDELICSNRRLQQAILLSRFIFPVHFFCLSLYSKQIVSAVQKHRTS